MNVTKQLYEAYINHTTLVEEFILYPSNLNTQRVRDHVLFDDLPEDERVRWRAVVNEVLQIFPIDHASSIAGTPLCNPDAVGRVIGVVDGQYGRWRGAVPGVYVQARENVMAKLRTEEELQQKRQDVRAINIAGRIQNLATQIYASRNVSIDEAWRLAREFMPSVAERTKAVYEELRAVSNELPPIGSKLRYMDGRIAVIDGYENHFPSVPIRVRWEKSGVVLGICWPLAECWTRI